MVSYINLTQGVLKSWVLVSLLNLQLLKFSSNSRRTVAKRVRSSLQTLKSEFFMPLTELGHRYSDRAFTNQAGYRVALEVFVCICLQWRILYWGETTLEPCAYKRSLNFAPDGRE